MDFIRQHLVCEDHQLTVLALWVMHTWCYEPLRATAYLNICSPEPESGKSLCLQILELLSAWPCKINGGDSSTVFHELLANSRIQDSESDNDDDYGVNGDGDSDDAELNEPWCTLFLDDCHHTFGTSERQPLISALNSGASRFCLYTFGRSQYHLFGPKAFAGNASLPRSLAARCIPCVLRRKKPSETIVRLHGDKVLDEALELRRCLVQWRNLSEEALSKLTEITLSDLPVGLSPREQDCAEPLIRIAAHAGGDWPEKARNAIRNLFQLSQGSHQVQLLFDIRNIFYSKDNPEYLPTCDLLSALIGLDHRPWAAWTSRSGKKIGGLLHPFGISSTDVRIDSGKVLKCYRLKDFQDAWERYLPPLTSVAQQKSVPQQLLQQSDTANSTV